MNRTILITAAFAGCLGILLGSFGAHGLERIVDAYSLSIFETGVRYQFYHVFLLLFLGLWDDMAVKRKKIIFGFIVSGIVLFCFSLYVLALNDLTSLNLIPIGILTPIGGLLLILGWFLLGYYILTKKGSK